MVRPGERIHFPYLGEVLLDPSMLIHNVFNQSLRAFELIWRSLNEHITHSSAWYLFLGHLDLTPGLHLQVPNGLSAFADDQTHTFVWHWNDECIRRGRPVRCEQEIVYRMLVEVFTHFLGSLQLF